MEEKLKEKLIEFIDDCKYEFEEYGLDYDHNFEYHTDKILDLVPHYLNEKNISSAIDFCIGKYEYMDQPLNVFIDKLFDKNILNKDELKKAIRNSTLPW